MYSYKRPALLEEILSLPAEEQHEAYMSKARDGATGPDSIPFAGWLSPPGIVTLMVMGLHMGQGFGVPYTFNHSRLLFLKKEDVLPTCSGSPRPLFRFWLRGARMHGRKPRLMLILGCPLM